MPLSSIFAPFALWLHLVENKESSKCPNPLV